ncbi:MAG TPA: hypothetical protein VD927_12370 [Chryseosolibacter sp.]|nr:hypothetical protein [Chryseosolibacter sp.]
MSKKGTGEAETPELVEVRNVEFDEQTDGLIDEWRGKQKRFGRKYKRGQAVVELAKIGLKAEGIE